jgi:hypothetical protein
MNTWIAIALVVLGVALLAWASLRVWRGMVGLPPRSLSGRSLRQNARVAEAHERSTPRIAKVVVTRQRNYRRPEADDVES